MSLNSTSMDDSVKIRLENPASEGELQAIRTINIAAFGGPEEAELVDQLRGGEALVSLVAECPAGLVGHVLFSRMGIRTSDGLLEAVALAPVAVLPEWQRRGVGGRLIMEGLRRMRDRGERIVIVVGHPGYYPQFGFSTDMAAKLEAPFRRESFMALELVAGALEGVEGAVVYPAAFGL